MPQINEHGEIETLVRTHAGWVHACASRRVGNEAMAQDVTQAVFILLWRRWGRLREGMRLTGWLYRAVRYCAADALRDKHIRERHEREAAMARLRDKSKGEAEWTEVSPELEQAVDRLGERDRSAVLLRFYRQMSYAEVGQCMGIGEEAARMRVQRAVEKLRGILGKKGMSGTTAGLSAVLVGNVVGQMPEHLAEKIVSVVGSGGGNSVAAGIAKGAMKMMVMAKVKVAAVAVVVVAAAVAIGGCGTSAVHVYDKPFPGPGSQYTLAGTTREQVIAHLGSPTSVSTRSDGREDLHYRVTGTKRNTYLLIGEKEHATVEDVDLLLDSGIVVSGSWRDSEGNTMHW